jgi:hypothetical protein
LDTGSTAKRKGNSEGKDGIDGKIAKITMKAIGSRKI